MQAIRAYLRPSENSTVETKSPVDRYRFLRSEFFNGLAQLEQQPPASPAD